MNTSTATTAALPSHAVSKEDSVYARVSRRIVPLIMLCYVVAYLDRVNVGFAKLQMSQALNFSETVYGLGAGIFFIGYFLFEVPSNLLMNKIGARIWIARIMITWGLISGAFAFVQTPTQFYAMRFLLGLAEAGFYPGIILYLTYWYPSHRRARIVAMFMAAIPISGIFGNPLSGWIMSAFHGAGAAGGWQGWQWMFVIEAIPAVLVGLLVLWKFDDSIRKAKWLSEDEKQILEANIAADNKGKTEHPGIGKVFSDPRVWMMSLIYFAFVMGQYGLTFWMPTLVKSAGVKDTLMVGVLSAIPYVCAAITMVLIGRSADARRERRWHLVVPALMGAVGFAVVAMAGHNVALSIVFLSLAAAGVLTCAPLFWSLPTAFLQGTAAAAGIAAINSVGNLAGFVSPYMIGALKDMTGSTSAGMYALAGVLVLGCIAVLRTPPKLVNK
ncbi:MULTISPECIES: MFS transporter [Ralstonia]|jgi:D-galactonate transporter|uniref:Metabolite transport protein NicT n=3 Tax=Ralstonia TaxID=48736 RepID=A0ABM9INW2_RALPI|nr:MULTISPECIES: MFS transporter [Ralstonia]MBA4201617.1 3-(3-hydroxy-phenyl)propionate transporter MhpT [Ralstonia sp.]MBA4231651.1 3-(3-hydroxy-phenyl)propionate transporter MhpT [Ralstonia sp.]MBA4238329.1 3-(3-hydroxy-phenyl)propionate transporter MhpT [Ralstonia sp.]MBA4402963.1 3-(3-hydroxy-phenyl)propionate transporter MhpT [Ralstonia sp.]POH87404.1 MFS transporter [Ralstonia pickettii]